MSQLQSKYRLKEVRTQESSFKNADANDSSGKFDVKVKLDGVLDEPEHLFTLNLRVNITNSTGPFEAYVHQIGVFEFEPTTQQQELSDFFLINAPALIFPYVRSYVSALTALSGYQTVTLPALNMTNLKEQLKENISRKGQA